MQTGADIAYFTRTGADTFRANDPSRGPWSIDHCHAGPVTGMVARAAERAVPGKMLTRLTVEVLRPVPMAGIRVVAEPGHNGRTVATATVEVQDMDGKTCVRASSMHLARAEMPGIPTAPVAPLDRTAAVPGPSTLPGGLYDVPLFGDFVEMAYADGTPDGIGPRTVWMKTPPLLADEAPSPIQALCPLADCGNALSRNAPFGAVSFLNTDLTLHIHREPEGAWFASETLSHWQPNGIGLAQATLHDERGPVAVALQTLVLRPMQG